MPKMAPPLPEGMIELMKQLSKSVLKDQPDNIYEHAAKYFEKLLIERDGCLDKGYGKFRSYSEYCKFMKKMDAKRPMRLKHIQDESDSGIGSSNTDEESKNLNRKPHKQPPPDMEINGIAIQAATRKTKAPAAQPRKTKNYSINPKFKPQGAAAGADKKVSRSIASNNKERGGHENENDKAKVKSKQRKLSSKKPPDSLIAITEETSVDVAEDNSDATKVKKSAAIIQRAFRAYLVNKALKMIETPLTLSSDANEPISTFGMTKDRAAVVIQNLFKNFVQKKRNSVEKIEENSADDFKLKEIEAQVFVAVDKSINNEIESEFIVKEPAEVENGDVQIVEEEIIVPVKVPPRHIEADMISDNKEENEEIENEPYTQPENISTELRDEKLNEITTEEANTNENSQDLESHIESENIETNMEENLLASKECETPTEEIVDSNSENVKSINEVDQEEIDEQNTNKNDETIISNQSESEVLPTILETEKEIPNFDPERSSNTNKNPETETEVVLENVLVASGEGGNSDEPKDEKTIAIEGNNATIDSENVLENEFNEKVNEIINETNNLLESHDNISQDIDYNIKETVQSFLETERDHNSSVNKEEKLEKGVINVEEILHNLPSVPDDDLSDVIIEAAKNKIEIDHEKLENINKSDEANKDICLSSDNVLDEDNLAPISELKAEESLEPKNVNQSENDILLEVLEKPNEENKNLIELHELAKEELILPKSLSDIGISSSDLETKEDSKSIELDIKETTNESSRFEEILEQCVTDEDINALASTRNGSIIKIHDLGIQNEAPFKIKNELLERKAKSLDIDINSAPIQPQSKIVEISEIESVNNNEENLENATENFADELPESLGVENNENINRSEEIEINLEPNLVKEIVEFCGTSDNPENFKETEKVSNEAESIVSGPIEESVTESTKDENGIENNENLNESKEIETNSEANLAEEIGGTSDSPKNCEATEKITNEAESIFLNPIDHSTTEKIVDAVQQENGNLLQSQEKTNVQIEPTAPLLEEITTADETAAAINIQKSYRGYRARRNVKSKTAEQNQILAESNAEHKQHSLTPSNVSISISSQDVLGDILTEEEHKIPVSNSFDMLSISSKHSIKPIEEVSETSDLSDRELDHIEEPIKNQADKVSSINDQQETEVIAADDKLHQESNNLSVGNKSAIQKQLSSDISETEDISVEKFKESGIDETSRDERDDELSELDNFDFSSCGEDSLEAMYYSLRKNEILLDKMQRQAAEQRNSIVKNSAEETSNEDQELLLEAIEMNKKLTEKIAEAEKSLSPVGQHSEKLEKENKIIDEAAVSMLSDDLTTAEDLTAINIGMVGKDFLIESDSATDNNDIVVGGTILESEDLTSSADDDKSLPGSAQIFSQIKADDFPKLLSDEYSDNSAAENNVLDLENDKSNVLDIADGKLTKTKSKTFEKFGDDKYPELLSDDHTDSIDDQYIHVDGSDQENENAGEIPKTISPAKAFETQKSFPKLLSDDLTDTPTDNDTNNEQNRNDEPTSTVSDSSVFDEKTSTAIDESSSVNEMEITNPIAYAMKQQKKFLNVMHPSSHQSAVSIDDDNTASEELDEFPDYPSEHQHLENIRRNILASSISEADSDYVAPSATIKHLIKDDFNISTALDHITSTDSDSTIISAATKIQAGARGFLTRRRLRRSSAGTSLSADRHCSFGNAAIDKSLEDLLEQQELNNLDDAAVKIQRSYRNYMDRKKRSSIASTVAVTTPPQTPPAAERSDTIYQSDESGGSDSSDPYGITEIKLEQKKLDQTNNENNDEHVKVSPASIDEHQPEYYKNIYVSDGSNSVPNDAQHRQEIVNGTANECQEKKSHHLSIMNFDELDTAQQRRMTLQRGDAVQRHSTPEEQHDLQQNGNNGDNNNKILIENKTEMVADDAENNINVEEISKSPATIMAEERKSVHRKLGPRQRSMPVQIETEFLRLIPKHLRKRIKSAGSMKQKY